VTRAGRTPDRRSWANVAAGKGIGMARRWVAWLRRIGAARGPWTAAGERRTETEARQLCECTRGRPPWSTFCQVEFTVLPAGEDPKAVLTGR